MSSRFPYTWPPTGPATRAIALLVSYLTLSTVPIHAQLGQTFSVSDSPAMPALIAPGSKDEETYAFLALQIQSGESSNAEQPLQTIVEQLEATRHRYHEDLIVPLTLLGDAKAAQKDYEGALDLYARARHIARVSQGLFDAKQLAVVYREADALISLGDLAAAGSREEYAYEVMRKTHARYDPATLPGLMRLADFYLNTFNYQAARTLYNAAMDVHTRNHTNFTEDAIPVLRGIAISHRLERYPPFYVANTDDNRFEGPTQNLNSPEFDRRQISFNNFPAGERALQQIVEIRQKQQPQEPLETLKAIVELADWHLMFGRSNMANTLYSNVYKQMLEAGEDAEDFFAKPALVYLPIPQDPRPPPRDQRDAPTTGFVKLAFDVAPTGRIRKLKTVESQPEKLMEFRVRRSMRLAVFRPMLVEGLPVMAEAQEYTHTFRYFPKADPAAAVINPAATLTTEDS